MMIDEILGKTRSDAGYPKHLKAYVVIPPPPTPAKARAAMSCVMVCAAPQSSDPMAKTVYANSRQLFRPNMSLSLP